MKLRKTPAKNRFRQEADGTKVPVYTMYFNNGDRVTYEPGKATTIYATGRVSVQLDDEITEITIKQLHRADDAEVESNLNHVHCETRDMRKEREAKKKEWALAHPDASEEDNPYKPQFRLRSFDYKPKGKDGDEVREDCSELEYEAATYQEECVDDVIDESEEESPRSKYIEMIRAYVATLPKSQQELYQLIYVEGLSQTEVCERLCLSKSTVSERCKTLENKLIKKFKK